MRGILRSIRFQNRLSHTLNAANIKAVGTLCMFLDHLAIGSFWISLERRIPACNLTHLRSFLRLAGRSSFPVFCFFLVEGFFLTGNRRRYFLRIFLFAFLSEIPFNLCLNGTILFPAHQNVLFTMALGLLLMGICEEVKNRIPDPMERLIGTLTIALYLGILATVLRFDYKLPGILLICILYLCRGSRLKQCALGFLSFIWEPASAAGFLLLLLYNGHRGRQEKYFFYLFYPYHLLLIYLLSHCLPLM